jgi:TATA-binding protein-associated factor
VRQQLQKLRQKKGRGKKQQMDIDDGASLSDSSNERTFNVRLSTEDPEEYINMRISCCRALAMSAVKNSAIMTNVLSNTIIFLLESSWAVHRNTGGLLVQELWSESKANPTIPFEIPEQIRSKTLSAIVNQCNYQEVQQVYSNLHANCHSLLQFYASCNIDVSGYYQFNQETGEYTLPLTLELANHLATAVYDMCATLLNENQPMLMELANRKKVVKSSMEFYQGATHALANQVSSILCCAIVRADLPKDENNLRIVVNSLLSGVQDGSSTTLQRRVAESLAIIVNTNRYNEYIINNLIQLAEQGTEESACRGGVLGIRCVMEALGNKIYERLPLLWNLTGAVVCNTAKQFEEKQPIDKEQITRALQSIRLTIESLHVSLHQTYLDPLLRNLLILLPCDIDQLVLSKCVAAIVRTNSQLAMKILLEQLIPQMGDPVSPKRRYASVSVIKVIVEELEMDILQWVVFFVVPLLKRMSDQDDATRELASACFASVIKLLPLEKSVASAVGFEEAREKERKFVEQLLDSSKVEPFEIPISINAELRQYQKDGISWLAFLNKYNLHGILCDDMGLGKTLQTICIVASDIEMRKREFERTQNPEYVHLPSLVVCPPTLVAHWAYEVNKFCNYLKIAQYSGSPGVRKQIRNNMPNLDIVIMSYDILRNDVDNILSAQPIWNYCVLDEGHVIKNKKTQITKAVKMIKANHRLILSGTPIQNNVLELWSLFDFLMPGFLGTEKEFNQKYSKPILSSKDAKANSREQAAGTLAMEALHRQVLPFLLRRVKEDVLHDLPEKIIQDYYCELSPLQQRLYEDFSNKHLKGETDFNEKVHAFPALQYLRKLCNHPSLVLSPQHPQFEEVMNELKREGKNLTDVTLSPKLLSLKQLLQECGIGVDKDEESAGYEPGHRVLLFCQMKSTLDIIENFLFKNHMPSVTYMRLDGDVEASKRVNIVNQFNADPTIDVLLLTTHVGGLGLNLTGADTVIFMEHDWNPSADLQAMDRAHRIGQKRVVNVYRLITKNTLEEKIMGLQKFKTNISRSVVNRDNSSLKTMDTEQLVDLFKLGESKPQDEEHKKKKTGAASILEEVGELWDDQKQYEEYDLNSFLSQLKN